ncbi:PglL family O-oligosaccharyltransferase [Enterobacter asburiae]|jgi:O-antigen polymerase|uniref:PglL family O-oligosaccharyltransferase n=1 Tax=Enterobacter asburiae TaxID=61645 RepID=UPI002CFF7BF1|nr:O-antigen ligase C-terminal domain-containing protein [Enterobacter asburiae]
MNTTTLPSRICVGALTFYLVIVLSCYFKNMGGEGLSLPQNILCWMTMVFVIALAGYSTGRNKKQLHHVTVTLFILAAGWMSLPLLWSHTVLNSGVILRIVGIWGAVMFYWALLQIGFTEKQKHTLLNAVCIAAVIQAGLAVWQLTGPAADNWMEFHTGVRPYGIFQQVNVLASFVATGWAISLFRLVNSKVHYQIFIWLTVNAFLSFVLYCLQSRAGLAGAILYLALMIVMVRKNNGKVLKSYLSLAAAGMFCVAAFCLTHWLTISPAGHTLFPALAHVDKASSSHERIAILQATWQMIMRHPFSGWGYGSYEYVVNRLALNNMHHLFPLNVSHPHNEVLFEWAEGGLPAVMGMLLLLAGAMASLRKANWEVIVLWGTLIPVTVHTMVEYPLYQSTPHLLVLLLLLRLADDGKNSVARPLSRVVRYTLPVIVLTGMLFLVTAFRTAAVLTHFEREGMQDFSVAEQVINPWAQYDRYHYDQATSFLMNYNLTHHPAFLDRYVSWGRAYIGYKNDVHVFSNLVAIDKVKPDEALALQLENEWRTLYRARGVTQGD